MSKTVAIPTLSKSDREKFCPRCAGWRSWLIVTTADGRKWRQCKSCGLKVQAL